MGAVSRSIDRLLESRYDARIPILVIAIVAVCRVLFEFGLSGSDPRQAPMAVLSSLSFYLAMYMMFSFLLSKLLGRPFENVANIVGVGLLFGLLPPLIDALGNLPGSQPYTYFKTFTWTLQAYDQPFGETAALWGLILATGFFVLFVTNSIWRMILGWAGAYAIVQTVALVGIWTQQSYLAFVKTHMVINVTLVGLSSGLYVAMRGGPLLRSLKRINHALPLGALTLCGAAWSASIEAGIGRALVVLAAFAVLILHNDYHDRREDALAGRKPSASLDDLFWSGFFLLLIASSFLQACPLLPWVVLVIFLLGTAYHHPALRFKERFCLSYKIEGAWALLAFVAGTLDRSGIPEGTPLLLPCLLVFGGGSLLSIPKDWKDVASDREAGIPTLYVILTRRGWSENSVHRLVTAVLVAALLVPPAALTITGNAGGATLLLWPPAFLAGAALCFVKARRISVELLFWLIALYLVVLAFALG